MEGDGDAIDILSELLNDNPFNPALKSIERFIKGGLEPGYERLAHAIEYLVHRDPEMLGDDKAVELMFSLQERHWFDNRPWRLKRVQ
jgi:hypothetical protein